MTEQKCAKIVAGKGLRSSTSPNYYIELPTTVFVVLRYFGYEEDDLFEILSAYINKDDAEDFAKNNRFNGRIEVKKLELKW